MLQVARPRFPINRCARSDARSERDDLPGATCTSARLTTAALTTTSRRVITIGIVVNGFRDGDTVIRAENSRLYRG